MRRLSSTNTIVRLYVAITVICLTAVPAAVTAQRSAFRSLSANEAARMIERESGHVTVVLLYAAYCPHCRAMFPAFVELAERYQKRDVSVLAFATDEDAEATDEYVGSQRLPFARLHIEPWKKGELASAFTRVGIEIEDGFGVPLLAILDGDGDLAGKWSGASGVTRAEQWLEKHVDS